LDTAQLLLDRANEAVQAGRHDEALTILNGLLNQNFSDPTLLYGISDLLIRKQWNGMAINLLGILLQQHPKFHLGWNNLGVAFRNENFYDFARAAWEKAIAIEPTVENLSNMATLSADMGDPDEAIDWCEQAIAMNPDHWQSVWNKSLAVLTKRDWAEGWRLYEYRKRLSGYDGRPTIEAPEWDGSRVGHLYVHGEQGVGDEVMFSSMLPDLLRDVDRVTVEAHRKFAGLLQQSFPGIAVVSTEQEAAGIHFDAKINMGSLALRYRTESEQFPGTPYLTPDPALVAHYRQELAKLGPSPHVAIAWMGGTKKTRVQDRSIPLAWFRNLLNRYTCVSAQYSLGAIEAIEWELGQAGLTQIDAASAGDDMHAQAALFAACDAVVTTCQTAVHVAGAVGAPCYVAVPNRPSWRYGIAGEDLPWYASVRLVRQGPTDRWMQVLSRIEQMLARDLPARRAAA
jgi:tetratricopeptide (TPR) repeat protein